MGSGKNQIKRRKLHSFKNIFIENLLKASHWLDIKNIGGKIPTRENTKPANDKSKTP
jgi:hypothetical protein